MRNIMSDTLSHFPVSVVMTTFNGEQFIKEQILSILNQTLPPEELIICDDGSTDRTIEIIEMLRDNAVIKLYQNEKRLGVIGNFKKAVSLAKPDNYIALSDQDDIWLPEKIEKSIAALISIDDKTSPAMVYSDLMLIDSKGNLINKSARNVFGNDKYTHCFQTLLYGNFVTGCTILMNPAMRKMFADIPDNPSFKHDAWLAYIAFSFGKISETDQPYIKYRQHDNNVTITGYKKKTRTERLLTHAVSVITKNEFLKNEIILADLFISMFEEKLSTDQKNEIRKLLKLRNASYLSKKWAFEKTFRPYWTKRF